MSTLRFAMRWFASTSARVSVGRSPSGTMATMMPIAKMKAFQKGMPISQPSEKKDRPISTARIAVRRLRCAISVRSGETSSAAVCVRCAILPNSVCIPVAKTTALACPDTIDVPASTTFLLSIRSSAADGPVSRALGSDSPVTAALLTRTPKASISRQSAGTLSPGSRWTMSPGTSSSAGTRVTTPARIT